MSEGIDGEDQDVLLEDIDLLGPSFHILIVLLHFEFDLLLKNDRILIKGGILLHILID
jgi:hypothetical protein